MGEESDMHDAALDAIKRKDDGDRPRDSSRDRRDDRKGDDRKDDRKDERRRDKRSRSKRSRSKRSRSKRKSRSRSKRKSRSRSRSRRRRSPSKSREKRRSRSRSKRRSRSRRRRSWSKGMERGGRDRSRDRAPALPPIVGPPMPQPAPLRPTRPPPMRPPNFRPGDWMCPKCHFHNYRSKQVCPQCATIMPAGANAIQVDMNEPGRRKTKWDDTKPPDWVQDLVDNEPKPKPPPGVDPENYKVLKCEAVQIRALIGKGGETIRELRAKSGTQINIDHAVQDAEGTVAIIGDVIKTERMIREVLESKGCPLGQKKLPDAGGPKQLALPPPPPVAPGAPPPPGPPAQLALPAPPLSEPVDAYDVEVPPSLVQPLIGPGGQHIKDVRAKVGGTVYISVLPPQSPGGPQNVRVVGDKREEARDMIWSMVEELKRGGQMVRPPPPPSLGGGPGMPPRGVTPPPPPSMTGMPRPPPQPPSSMPPQPPSNLPGAGGAMAKPLPVPPPQLPGAGGCGGCDGSGTASWGGNDSGSGGNNSAWGDGSGWGDVHWGDVPPGHASAHPAPGGPGMGIQAKGCPPPPNMMPSGELAGQQVVGPRPSWGGPGLAGPPPAAPPAPPAPRGLPSHPGPGLAGPPGLATHMPTGPAPAPPGITGPGFTGLGQQPMTSAPIVMTLPASGALQSEPPKVPPKQDMPQKPHLARASGLAGLQALQNFWGRPRG